MKKDLKDKILSFTLALLMLLSSFLGYIPATTIHAAANGAADLTSIKKGTDITTVDPDFDSSKDMKPFTFQFNKSAGMTTNFACTGSPISNEGKQNYYFHTKGQATTDGRRPLVKYYHVAKNPKNGKWYDLRISFTDIVPAKCTIWHNGVKYPPTLLVNKNKIGINLLGLDHVTCIYNWYYSSDTPDANGQYTSSPIPKDEIKDLRSYITLVDLDYEQSFMVEKTPGIVGVYKYDSTQYPNHIYQGSDGRVMSEKRATTSADQYAWVMAYLKGTDEFTVTFYADEAGRQATGDFQQITESYGIPSPSYYVFRAQNLFKISAPDKPPRPTPVPGQPDIPNEAEISKAVGPKDCGWDGADSAESKETAYRIHDYDEYDYVVQAGGPGIETEKYEITDTLEACLAIDDNSKVTILDKDGKNVTGFFNVTVKGQTIKCEATAEYMKTDSFKDSSQMFTVSYTVHRRKDKNVREFMGPWLDEDGFTFYVPNKANVMWHTKENGTTQAESEECWVTDIISSKLAIEKDAKYDDWKVGDEVTYAVEVTQTQQDGYAVNVTITDDDIPPYLKLLNNEWTVSGPNYGEAASISSKGTNGWVVTCPLLMYEDSIKVEFKCLALEDSNGKDTLNTAKAVADNFVDDGDEPLTVSDSAEVWVNSPVLTVDKVADRYEYEVGDDVTYTVNVNNTADYTIAKNVVVSDIDLPEGLELQGEPEIDMGDAQTSIGWPVADGSANIAKEMRDNEVTLEKEELPIGNSWTLKAKYFPSGQPIRIVFHCKATKAVNGIESQNVVTATADNFLSLDENQEPLTAQDDAEVYVNTAYFDIEKITPDYEWQVGDHVPFDIIVRNVNDEETLDLADDPKYADLSDEEKAKIGAKGKTVARNVVITDEDIPEGFILDFDSIDVQSVDAQSDLEAQIDALYDEEMNAGTDTADGMSQTEQEILAEAGIDFSGTDEYAAEAQPENGVTQTEEEILAEAGIDFSGIDDYSADSYTDDYAVDDYTVDGYTEDGYTDDYGMDGLDTMDGYDMTAEEEPSAGAYEEPWTPRPADPMTVQGIPDSYDNHIAGTPDETNRVDEVLWNENENVPITKTLERLGNGWQLKISDLPAGNDVVIHFTCEATQPGNGQEGVNIGTVTANNAPEKSDDSEAYINTASLSIDKLLVNAYAAGGAMDAQDGREGYEFRVGEDVEYRLVVNNNQKGSIARNVVISDVTIPQGLELDPSSIMVEGLPDTYVNPIAGTEDIPDQTDPDHYNETEVNPVIYSVEETEGGFRVLIDNLPCTIGDTLNNWTSPVVITYHCTPTEFVNGNVIVNTAKAVADNAAEVKDSERIWINNPILYIAKGADKPQYLVGDTITYTVDVEQMQAGCLARNITISDVIDTEGVKLQKNSIVLIDQDGNVIQPESVDINGNTFTVYTGRHLVGPQGYTQTDLDKIDEENGVNGYMTLGGHNPLGIDRESKMTLEYAVEVVDTDLAGQTVHNIATVNSDENIPEDDEIEVPITGPALDIVKESNKTQYQIGEEAQYKLTVRSIYEDTLVKQVVIRDGFQEEGMKISRINVRLNGENLEDAIIIQETDNSFYIETGVDIGAEDKIEVFYTVVFTDPALHGHDIINIASAQGSNTEEEFQDNSVRVVDETPGLEIEKKSDKEYYKVGDTGHYTVTVTNKEKGTTARNVIIKDQLETEGAKIVKGSIVIRNDNGKVMDDAEIQYSDSRYAIYTGHDLEYKEEMTVTYDVLFEEETLAGKDILNIARATCDNLRVETKVPDPIKLSNGLVVYKSSDPATGSVVKNGDPINYSISVTNTSSEAIKNVLVKDRIPDYMEYVSSEEQDGVICDTRILDGELYATFVIENLEAGEERTVTFTADVVDAPQEAMLVNVAQVRNTRFDLEDMTDETWMHDSFRNTNETVHYTDTRWVKDQNTVYIDSGKLSIDKSSDKANYSVGETGHYTVTVAQKVKGAVARNVVVSDEIQKKGAYIQKDSIRAYIHREGAEEEEELTDIHVVAKDFSYTVYTNTNLKYGEEIHIRYDVLFQDAALEGQQIKNVAMAKDDSTPEGDEPTDDNRVTVGDAGLIIEKSSDKARYHVGDVGKYTLKITCSDPARTIENVVVKDVVKQQGAHLVTGTVRTYYDNEELKVNVDEKDNGFVVETHHNLSGTHVIWVTYDVVFESESLNGKTVDNIATTWGDNTNPSDDTNTVYVGEGEKPGPDKPDPTPGPDKPHPDKPDPTPGPDKPTDPVKGMTLTKTANRHKVTVGDRVSYTLLAKTNSGSITAKNVVISDTLDPEYFEYLEIDKDSFRSYIDDAEFHGQDLNISDTGFTLKTGKDLAPGQVLKVTYDVLVKDEALKGKTLKNTAVVYADNFDEAKDKEAVSVATDDKPVPGLDITKNADTHQAYVGDTVGYTLTVRPTTDQTAENVVIKDKLKTTGASLVTDSIRVYLDNAEISPEKVSAMETGFTISTGRDLAPGQEITVKYDVVYTEAVTPGDNVENTATASADNMDPSTDDELVHVLEDPERESGLTIDKEADREQVKVGGTVKYTLAVKTTSKETAKNVVISDTLEQSGATIVKDSIKAYLGNAQFKPSRLDVDGTGFTMETGKNLKDGQVMKVTYEVTVDDESLEGKNIRNTAVATSDNFDPADDTEIVHVPEKGDPESGLMIDKAADRQKVSVGGTVKYTLLVKTISKETAKNVVVKDTLAQSGVTVVKDSIKGSIDNAQFKPDKLAVDGSGFTMETGKDLKAGQVMKVTYEVTVDDESLEGKNIRNTAVATSDNFDPADDTETVYVPEPESGGLTIVKNAGSHQVNVGDTVRYTLTVKTTGRDAAKNVVVKDKLAQSGASIIKDSIKGYIDNAQFKPAKLTADSTGFTMQTGKDLAEGQVMTVVYDVKVTDKSLVGKTVKNTAVASSDNFDPVDDTETVYVPEEPKPDTGLDITKNAASHQAKVGDTVKYTLTVKATGKDAAKNVVVKDTLDQAGAAIDKSTIETFLDNAQFRPSKISADSTGFTVETGKDLKAGQVMKVTYNVTFTSESLAGKTVKNTASASADNMEPVKDNETVTIAEPPVITSGLDLVKTADHSMVNVGATVKYTLTARTTSSVTAKNVVVKDGLDNDKAVIDRSSVKAYLNDALFTPAKLNVTTTGFTMVTGKDLSPKDMLKVTYEVRMADESLAGKTVGNTAVLTSDNLDTVDDDEEVYVNAGQPEGTPMLSIDKVSNVSQALPGSTITYVISVKQTVKGQVAENVVIRDAFDVTGMSVGGIQVTLDGTNISANVSKEADGLVIRTGKDLPYGSVMKVTYAAKVSDLSLAGQSIRNTAAASADNASEVSANAYVQVPGTDPTQTPDPTQAPAQPNDNTTSTIGPKTGLTNHAGLYAGIGVGIVAVVLIYVFVMRRKKNDKTGEGK